MKKIITTLWNFVVPRKFAIHNISNSSELTIWSNDLDTAEKLWQKTYIPNGWDIKEPIKTKWNWRKFSYEYRFKLIKL